TGPAEPSLTNLGYRRSNTDGSWPAVAVGTQAGGDGFVFGSDATINQNDWTMVPVSTSNIYVFRRNAAANGIDGVIYNVATNKWSALSSQPAAINSKPGSGVFGATDGTNIYVFVIGTDSANTIFYTKYNGTSWTAWSAVGNTGSGGQTRNYIS